MPVRAKDEMFRVLLVCFKPFNLGLDWYAWLSCIKEIQSKNLVLYQKINPQDCNLHPNTNIFFALNEMSKI